MAQLPGWMPILLDRISWGCSTSPWFSNLADENKITSTGRQICLDLWPFIRELPTNISAVRDQVPEHMSAAWNLLGQLADDERHYQQLFLKQCYLAELDENDLNQTDPAESTEHLCQVMRKYCRESSFVDGIFAIVAAEMAATYYSRAAHPHYERYFQRHADEYPQSLIDEGLKWLRLHAKPHTRHARWMTRMLGDIENSTGNEIPPAADDILNAVLILWQCPTEDAHPLLGRA